MTDTTLTSTPAWIRENVWDLHHAARLRYEDRGQWFPHDVDPTNRCAVCGRKVGTSVLWAEVSVGGDVILPGDERSNGLDSQGWWALGSECAKRVLTRDEIKMVRASNRPATKEA